jgi:hypothetical protein
MRLFLVSFIAFFSFSALKSQELFPLNEPASTVPKGVLGIRLFSDSYQEVKILRNMYALRLMYGVLPKLTVEASASVSNHHGRDFPAGLATHTHSGTGSVFSTGNFTRGVYYPYLYTGIYIYAKYRFLTFDSEHRHFRMAAYADWSNVNVAHDEAEPNLLDDTKGYGGGLITTFLNYHLAVSLNTGVIIPGKYNGLSPDIYGGPMVPTELRYGNAVKYNLSFGYLLFPHHYENYNQTNLNIYLEFMGKSYGQATVIQYGDKNIPISTPLLKAGSYVDVCPGFQCIIKSNSRIDFSVEFPLINKSYAHFYPVFMLGVQRYIFFNKKSDKPKSTGKN